MLVDGQDLRDVTGDSLRRQMSIVNQVNFLFSGTVFENIRFGRPAATDEEIIAVVRQLDFLDVIGTLPLPGQDLDPRNVAAPLQTATAEDLDQSLAVDLSEYLRRRLNGVYANDIQPEMLELLGQGTRKAGLTNVVPVLGTVTDPRLAADSIVTTA